MLYVRLENDRASFFLCLISTTERVRIKLFLDNQLHITFVLPFLISIAYKNYIEYHTDK